MRRLLAAMLLGGGLAVAGPALPAGAAAPCDTYSGGCQPSDDAVPPPDRVRGVKRTLPITGGELVLLTLAGAGAVAGGSALVLSVRRRAAVAP